MKPRIVRSSDATLFNVLGNHLQVRLNGRDTGGMVAVVEQTDPPGTGVPPHVHTREDEIFHVMEGTVQFVIDGQPVTAEAGTTVFAPRNVPHGLQIAGNKPARVMITIYPAGIESMFEELHNLPPGPPDMKKVAEICGQYGVRFV